MGATYLGSVTVSGAIPGASAKLSLLSDALSDIRITVDAQIQLILDAVASISAQVQACADAQIAIRIAAIADFQVQLDAALDISASLGLQLSDPALYLSGLLTGLLEVQASLGLLVPSIALSAQISASAGVALSASIKIAAVDLQLQALVAINLALGVIINALLAIQVALSAAVSLTIGALNAYASFAGLLARAGIHAFLYDGALSGLGASIDSIASVSAGISGAANVRVPIIMVDTAANPSGLLGVNAVFRVS